MRTPSSSSTKKATPCCSKVGIKRGPWTPEEDELLANCVSKEGEGRWRTLPKRAGLLRCGKSCRLRWMNYLRPNVKRGRIAPDEEDLILRLHRLLGNRWSLIAGRIPGRTDNEIKNYWNTNLSKKLISQGIDPRTHKPLNPNLNNIPQQFSGPTSSQIPEASKICQTPTSSVDGHQNQVLNKCDETSIMLQNVQRESNLQDWNIGNENYDDDFSSFLDSLMNDNSFLHQQQLQPLEPLVQPFSSSAEAFSQPVWEDELSSVPAFGDNEGSLNHHSA